MWYCYTISIGGELNFHWSRSSLQQRWLWTNCELALSSSRSYSTTLSAHPLTKAVSWTGWSSSPFHFGKYSQFNHPKVKRAESFKHAPALTGQFWLNRTRCYISAYKKNGFRTIKQCDLSFNSSAHWETHPLQLWEVHIPVHTRA